MFELQLLDDHGQVEVRVPLGTVPLDVGRSPHNHLVVGHSSVSGRHASFFVAGGQVFVEDLGSSNGSTIAGAPVRGRVALPAGGSVLLGGARQVRVVTRTASASGGSRRWLVRPLGGEAARAVDRERFRIGPEADDDLTTPDGPARVLLLDARTGELALADGDDSTPLGPGDELEVGTSRFVLELAPPTLAATILVNRQAYPYQVRIRSDGGAESVSITDPGGASCVVTAPNRVALLTVLAQRLTSDRTSGSLADTERGWVADEDIAVGIWGRGGRARPVKVELCRTRGQLRKAGLDGWCLEKRGSLTRLRAQTVEFVT